MRTALPGIEARGLAQIRFRFPPGDHLFGLRQHLERLRPLFAPHRHDAQIGLARRLRVQTARCEMSARSCRDYFSSVRPRVAETIAEGLQFELIYPWAHGLRRRAGQEREHK